MKNILLILFLSLGFQGLAQDLTGIVVNQDKERLVGASIYWQGATNGVYTNEEGYFKIPRIEATNMLVISYVGYTPDTLAITPDDEDLIIFFAMGVDLGEIVITEKERDSFISTLKTFNIEQINSGELRKAACCNLSESFETNGAVNVAYSDAVTGAKEIEMLGLRGVYTQMQIENRPSMRGLGYPFGMEYIPGTWVKSIAIAKGASTVVNGYEGIAGNINVELIKPFEGEKLHINGYTNHVGRTELNVHLNHQLTDKWSVGALLHGNLFNGEVDHNEDGFMDIPQKQNLNGLFRAFYRGETLRGQFNVQALSSRFQGGQVGFEENTDLYGVDLLTNRVDVFAKIGYLGFDNQFASLGWITNATFHQNDGFFGRNNYDATQRSFYTNLIYDNIIRTTDHKYKTGASFMYDDYDETFADVDYSLTESAVGGFFEYNFLREKTKNKDGLDVKKTFGLVLGLRADYHNLHGLFVTPRMNIRYNFDDNTVVRFNAGRGYRTARILAENISALTSARVINVLEDLDAEEAWNAGINFTKNFEINDQSFSFSTDLYTTHFVNQIVMDREQNDNEIRFYNLKGQSYSNSFLTSLTADLSDYLEVKLAYKFNDVKVTFEDELLQVPLVARHRGLVTVGLNTLDESWKLHTTMQLVGQQRVLTIKDHSQHSAEGHGSLGVHNLTGVSPRFLTINAQLTKTFNDKFEVYLGGENLTNYTQHNAIIGASDPFNQDNGIPVFDASQVYAPIMGTMIYAGFRFTIE
jgi:hypothetical protein